MTDNKETRTAQDRTARDSAAVTKQRKIFFSKWGFIILMVLAAGCSLRAIFLGSIGYLCVSILLLAAGIWCLKIWFTLR